MAWYMHQSNNNIHTHVGKNTSRSTSACKEAGLKLTINPNNKVAPHPINRYCFGAQTLARMDAGETVYIPTGWWHVVMNLDPIVVAVTQNFAEKRFDLEFHAHITQIRACFGARIHNENNDRSILPSCMFVHFFSCLMRLLRPHAETCGEFEGK